MVEVTQEDREAAMAYLSPAIERTVDGLAQAFARHRQAGVRQGLDMAAGVAEEGPSHWRDKSSVTANKRESRDYETMAIACIHVAAAIRAMRDGVELVQSVSCGGGPAINLYSLDALKEALDLLDATPTTKA